MEFRDDLIVYQRDFFDMGAMVYEHVPLLRGLIKVIKAKPTEPNSSSVDIKAG